jgi:hypothetical protein
MKIKNIESSFEKAFLESFVKSPEIFKNYKKPTKISFNIVHVVLNGFILQIMLQISV